LRGLGVRGKSCKAQRQNRETEQRLRIHLQIQPLSWQFLAR
jgi:hypothetical protein